MAIHSIDNKTEGVQDQMQQVREGLGTTSISPVIEGQEQGYVTTRDAQILVNDGTYNRVAIGQRNDGTYGIKVSKSGNDALTAANSNLVMSSDFNMFKIVATGTFTFTADNPYTAGTIYTTSVNHNLGYEPVHLVYQKAQPSLGSQLHLIPRTANDATATFAQQSIPYIDSTTLTLSWSAGGAAVYNGSVWTYKYYLMQETAS